MADNRKPQLGHYRIHTKNSGILVCAVPLSDGIMLRLNDFAAILNATEAREIAHGLIIGAERLEYPHAIAGPNA